MGKEVELNWQNHSNGITEQRIYRSVDGGQEVLVTAVAAAVKSFTDPVVGTPSTLTYKVGSVYINNGEEHVVASNPLSITLPQSATAKPMIGETAGQDLSMVSLGEIKLTVDCNVIPSTNDAEYWSYSVPWTGVPQVIEINSTDLISPLPLLSFVGGLGKITQWADVGYSVVDDTSILLGPDIIQVPATLHPTITCTGYMFYDSPAFNQDLSGWDVSNVTNMSFMFSKATSFNQPIGGWNTSKVTSMASMFEGATAFNQPIGTWDTSNVKDMMYMFSRASSFNHPLNWNTFNVTTSRYMFADAISFNSDISSLDFSNVTNTSGMFVNAAAFNQPITWNFNKVTNLIYMFKDAAAFNQDISGWDVSNVVSAYGTFQGCTVFNQDISGWNTAKIADMSHMFSGAIAFSQNLSQWCVSDILTEPAFFNNEGGILTAEQKPVWGTCPRGENILP